MAKYAFWVGVDEAGSSPERIRVLARRAQTEARALPELKTARVAYVAPHGFRLEVDTTAVNVEDQVKFALDYLISHEPGMFLSTSGDPGQMKTAATLSSIVKLDHLGGHLARAQERVKQIVPDLKQVTPKKDFHLTLSYAKDVKPQQVQETSEAMRDALEHVGPVPFSLNGVQSFENPQGQGVVVFGIEHKYLDRLHQVLKRINEKGGGKFTFPRFKPHATIGYTDKPLTPEQKKQLADVFPHKIEANPKAVDITTKQPDESWKLLHRVKFAGELNCGGCGYYVGGRDLEELLSLVDADGAQVDWGSSGVAVRCPQCGARDLRSE